MMRRLILPLVLLLLIAPSVFAQTPTNVPSPTSTPSGANTPPPTFALQPGTVEGNINDTVPSVRYSFAASSGDSVSISMDTTSGDLDPFLNLFGPDGALVDHNDDRASGDHNALIALTLTSTGTYVIEATRYAETATATSGTFRLTLAISGSQSGSTPSDPLSVPPNFTVTFTTIDYQNVIAGMISADAPQQYYAIGGKQGDLVRVIMTRTTGAFVPNLRVLDGRSNELSRQTQTKSGESIAYVTLPQTGWYLIEAGRGVDDTGTGGFSLYATRLAASTLEVGQSATGTFTAETPSLSYIVNARIGDEITLTMFTSEASSDVQPQLELFDLGLNLIGQAQGQRFVTLRVPIPRSGPYILQASNLHAGTSGSFNLRLSSTPGTAINAQAVSYNNQYKGVISTRQPLQFYHFSGKTGELVTISMSAANSSLNAYLILMDSDLNELASNDDVSNRLDARIAQVRLPKDGQYYILATRSGLQNGTTTGAYTLALTAGEISLTSGAFTATLRWTGVQDLNLFVRDPSGRTVSWASPQVPDGGTLQIDSNTLCQTPSAEPVEHSFWPTLVSGDYEVWAWEEDSCGGSGSVPFTLDVDMNGTPILQAQDQLNNGQRYQVGLRVTSDGEGFVVDPGAIITPTAQERVSEGGDPVIFYGQTLTGTISSDVYALFYQFAGKRGDHVELDADQVTGDLDPVIALHDAADNPLPDASNDDASPSTQNARLLYTLPADGTYIIAVTRFGVGGGTTTGDFRLRLISMNRGH